MESSSIVNFIFIFTLISMNLISESDGSPFFKKHQITITCDLPSPLLLRCKSADDDLGIHTLQPGQTYDWSFRTTYPGTTLFSCDFAWGLKKAGFPVFDADVQSAHTYNYVARPDGFYVGTDPTNRTANLSFKKQWDG